ncbi:unnamed protein product [Vitrella brassicaformis CCMP3155]|uniref:Transmembrane protein 208 n=1 Tax=Vitrella brassicaformis (strain CCMP3155) TaxID=1169540 RepID=A0A0G4FP18_VITBC|nr:unnamed protein product [Vitrella brassicaformis CCMP3155]|mmetsp:Transcript_22771/g.56207  ORF Transcript_22771/g.56207 Transcript_22771/m.56207 type:complete len:153 (-) Transcript_22771:435-893(-)|eukprot:CEM15942.1 unnamed protein product [Vitrella brassicaformis CCMP3155]
MAGQAAKKASKKAQEAMQIYLYVIIGVQIPYVLVRFLWQFRSVTHYTCLGYVFLAIVYYFTYTGMAERITMSLDYSYFQDVFIVNAVVQLLTTFSDWFWLVYLVVPGYAIWRLASSILQWVFTPEPDTGEEDEKTRKKREKANRPRFKLMKR